MLYFKRRLKIYKAQTPFPGRPTTRPGTTQTLKGLVKRMLKNMTARERKTLISFSLVFDDGHNNGFGFPCDKEGNVKNIHPEAAENLAWCKEHPEVFVRFNEVITIRQTYTEPAHGICKCGEVVILENQYHGACECPKCGQWYNLFGQSLLPPDMWEDELEEDW